MRNRLVACVSAIILATVLHATEPESAGLEADQYANSVRIKPLREGDADELRYWVSGVVITVDRATGIPTKGYGTLVTVAGITQCRLVVADPAIASGVHYAPCESIRNPSRARRILGFLPELSKAGLKECQVLDGDEWVIDGLFNGHRFTFRTYSPQFCNDVIKDMTAFTDKNAWLLP